MLLLQFQISLHQKWVDLLNRNKYMTVRCLQYMQATKYVKSKPKSDSLHIH